MTAISPWDAMLVTAKAFTYAATLGAAGGVFFLAYSHPLIAPSSARRIRRMIRVLLIVSAVASVAKILLTASSMSGDVAGMFDVQLERMILRSGEGRSTLIRLVGLLFMAWNPAASSRPPALAVFGSLAVATSFAWVGHVHALAGAALPTLVIMVHLLGVAFWIGALAPLLMVSRDPDVSQVAAATARFGVAALFIVAALLAAGVCLLFLLLRSVAELWTGSYGRFILSKIGCVAVLLALAAFNHWRLTPRLLAQDSRAMNSLRASIRFEMSLAAVILLVTAAMTTLTGPTP